MARHGPEPDRCPCGSGLAYSQCCGRWHAGPLHLAAPSAEALMRSRYSAFARRLPQYLADTWHPSHRPAGPIGLDPQEHWIRLRIVRSEQLDATHALVEYIAVCKVGGRALRQHEASRFVLEDGRWYYVDGDLLES